QNTRGHRPRLQAIPTFCNSLLQGGVAARSKKSREASLARADGDERSTSKRDSAQPVIVVFNLNKILWNLITTPSAPIEVASRHFIDVASTPPHQRGGVIA